MNDIKPSPADMLVYSDCALLLLAATVSVCLPFATHDCLSSLTLKVLIVLFAPVGAERSGLRGSSWA